MIGPIEHALQVVRARIRCACSDPRAELVPACSAPLEVEEELVGIARDDLEAERRRAGVYAPRVTWGTVRESRSNPRQPALSDPDARSSRQGTFERSRESSRRGLQPACRYKQQLPQLRAAPRVLMATAINRTITPSQTGLA